jgi:hypothetical protein
MSAINVFLTDDEVCGLPGPNLYFQGSPEGFDKLSYVIQELLQRNNHEVCLNILPFLRVSAKGKKVLFKSSENGRMLSQVKETEIITNLSVVFWEKLFIWCVLISRGKGSTTVFIDFEDENLHEDCNIIWEC